MPQKSLLRIRPDAMPAAGLAADQAAAHSRFVDYHQRRSPQTLRRQQADLALFAEFLTSAGVLPGDLFNDPAAWRGVTWGLVEAFVKWQLGEGYAVTSVIVRLSTVKTYPRLAMQAGTLPAQDNALIRAVQGYSHREQRRIDQRRPVHRVGLKKPSPILLTAEQAAALKLPQAETPQARRDALLMCLLLDHGLRAGEVIELEAEGLDLVNGFLRFYRPKVGKTQVHRLSPDTLAALKACKTAGELLPSGPLLRRMDNHGHLQQHGLTARAVSLRVQQLGAAIGVANLSAHDCRHTWATTAARHSTSPFDLQEAGGWSSLEMPRRYVEANDVANKGIKLE